MSEINSVPATEATAEVTTETAKKKRARKSFDEAKAIQIEELERKIANAKEHLVKLEAELEKVKARQPAVRKPSPKAAAKKLADQIMKSSASPENKRKALTLLQISDVEGLL